LRWPDVINEDQKLMSETYELPDEALRQVPALMRQVSASRSLQ
jgi:hypothetical protein